MGRRTSLEGLIQKIGRGLLVLAIAGLCTSPCQAEEAAKFVISRVIADASEILADSEIESITGRYAGRDVTIADLNAMVEEINALYRQKGFVTAKALLPAQKIENGVVRIRLVEGRVGRVLVEGHESAAASYFTRRIRLVPGDLIRLDEVTKEVSYFNRVNDDQVRVQLQPGEEFGTTDCLLIVQEPQDQRVVFVDNSGRDETGLVRLGATYVRNHLFGRGDPLTVSGVWAKGTLAGSVSYRVPVGIRGARITVGFDGSQIDVLSPGFEDLDIKGYSSDLHAEFSYPLAVMPRLRVWGPVQVHRKRSNSTFSGASLVSATATTVGVGLNAQWVDSGWGWNAHCDYQRGEVELGSGKSSDFQKAGCSFTWQKAFAGRYALTARGALQGTKEQLPSSEKFSVGGAATVRGHPEGALTGDQGYYTTVELEVPISHRLSGSVFVDHGGAFPAGEGKVSADKPGHLTGMGVGLTVLVLPNLTGKAAYGMSENRSPRIHASLQASF